jgi:phosphoglycerate kinase
MAKLGIDSLELSGKRVLVRVDFNVPLDEHGAVTDDTRIRSTIPTIRKIIDVGGRAILMSHLGRPKGAPNAKYSLVRVAQRLSELMDVPVAFAGDCVGPLATSAVAALKSGEVLLLENLRFHAEEEANDDRFSKELASLGTVYVNDAFGSAHRAHASTVGVTKYIAINAAGYLMQKELKYLERVTGNPQHPVVAILGGSKISGKIDVIQNLFGLCDTILIGGGMMFTFNKALGRPIGASIVEEDKISMAQTLIGSAAERKVTLMLPVDCIVADRFSNDAHAHVCDVREVPDGWMGLDIGPTTQGMFADVIMKAKTVVWNGPMGVFEMPQFAEGTRSVAEAMAKATRMGATTVVGGGDSAAAITQMGYDLHVSHVSTGGGATLEFLEGKILPGVAALSDASS